jgi:hypothetical protein
MLRQKDKRGAPQAAPATLSGYDAEQLDGFRRAQALAYRCCVDVAGRLRQGMTERHATKMMADYLREHGVREYFHKPFAWFGDRSTLERFWTSLHFFPTWRRLRYEMPFILDVAPILDGFPADVGYAGVHGTDPLWELLDEELRVLRDVILDEVRAKTPFGRIYELVDQHIVKAGFEVRHERYPARVLAHRVFPLRPSGAERIHVGGFSLGAVRGIRRLLQEAKRGAEHAGPFWNDRSSLELAPHPGIWAVEPHLAFRGIGVKWEELLVITEDDAYWLDDDLPHVNRWRARAAALGRVAGAG